MSEIVNMPGVESRFTRIPNGFARNPEVSPRAARVFIFMRSHRDGWSLSSRSISKALGMGKNTVAAALADLEALGYLRRVQLTDEGGRFGGSRYELYEEPQSSTEEPSSPCTENRDTEGVHRVPKNGTPKNGTPKIGTHKNTKTKKTNLEENHPLIAGGDEEGAEPGALLPVPSRAEVSVKDADLDAEEFAEWWSHYPRKRDKQAALRAYVKARSSASAEDLARGLIRSLHTWREEDRHITKIPYPATWLNSGAWEDEADDWSGGRSPGVGNPFLESLKDDLRSRNV